MAKYTLELLTKMTLNVPKWPSYSFDLHGVYKTLMSAVQSTSISVDEREETG